MNDEKIRVRVTETGHTMDVVVLSKRPDRIEVVLGEGVHSVRCALTPHLDRASLRWERDGARDRIRAQSRASSRRHRKTQPNRAQEHPSMIGARSAASRLDCRRLDYMRSPATVRTRDWP